VRVILTIAGLSAEYGGPSESVPALAESLARLGVDVQLATCRATNGRTALHFPQPALVKTRLVSHANRATRWRPHTNEFVRVLRQSRDGPAGSAIVHDTGLWLASNHAVAYAARRFALPRVVSPRGMLSGWALDYKGWRKHVAWWLYQRRDLQCAQVLHATSRQEAEEFRAADLAQPVAVVPNGVRLPEKGPRTTDNRTTGLLKAQGRKVLIYFGRLHPIKGLPNLVRAWGELRPQGWRVVVAGQDENGHKAEVESIVRQLGVEKDFEFAGPIEANGRWDLYRSADLFVLPSYSENFGLVVGEALACSVPVITTRATPWDELRTHRCGWWIETGAQSLATALREAMALNDEQRHAMGQRGRQWIETKYTWEAAAKKMMAVYEWMLERGPKPECVV